MLLLLLAHPVAAQYTDTVFQYFDMHWKQVDGKKDQFCYFRIARKTEENKWHIRDYYRDTRILQCEGMYMDDSMTIKDGLWRYYYYNGQLKKECSFYNSQPVGLVKSYSINGRLLDSARYKSTGIPYHKTYAWDEAGHLRHYGEFDVTGSGEGYETAYYDDSTIYAFGKYTKGYVKDSVWTYYHSNGNLSFTETFDSGKTITYNCYDIEGKLMTDNCDSATYMPEPGYNLYEYLYKNMEVPLVAREDRLVGRFVVSVAFMVDIDGKIKYPHIELGSFDFFNEEALRVVKTFPKWNPGKTKNTITRVHYTLPVTFLID